MTPDPTSPTREQAMQDAGDVHPIHVPEQWDDHDLLTFEQFCDLIQVPPRTVRDWRRRNVGPRWTKLHGTGRLYLTVAETRRFLRPTNTRAPQVERTLR